MKGLVEMNDKEKQRHELALGDMYEALKACHVSLIDDECYQQFKPLLKTIEQALSKADGK